MNDPWTLEHAIEIAKIGGRFRSYDGTGGIWAGRNNEIPDGIFNDWGLARATTIILNAVLDGRLVQHNSALPASERQNNT